MIGNSRVLETDLKMYKQQLDLLSQVNYEIPTTHSTWNKDIQSWSDSQIVFTVPLHASKGPLQLQIQKRTGYLESLLNPSEPLNIIDAQTYRIRPIRTSVTPVTWFHADHTDQRHHSHKR